AERLRVLGSARGHGGDWRGSPWRVGGDPRGRAGGGRGGPGGPTGAGRPAGWSRRRAGGRAFVRGAGGGPRGRRTARAWAPPFGRRRRDLEPGLRGYKDVNLQALRRLAPGGWLLTSSCSQHLSRVRFREVVVAAAGDAARAVTVVAEWGHPPDHPVALAHPE